MGTRTGTRSGAVVSLRVRVGIMAAAVAAAVAVRGGVRDGARFDREGMSFHLRLVSSVGAYLGKEGGSRGAVQEEGGEEEGGAVPALRRKNEETEEDERQIRPKSEHLQNVSASSRSPSRVSPHTQLNEETPTRRIRKIDKIDKRLLRNMGKGTLCEPALISLLHRRLRPRSRDGRIDQLNPLHGGEGK